mmetsp:Transcript_162405/g.311786  ORF Transcript_162405/g.311786 Transcript_162405/m.311786 type:complete len:591 (+) Transcript_162405:19-1791(+)
MKLMHLGGSSYSSSSPSAGMASTDILQTFKQHDSNSDGYISAGDLRVILQTLDESVWTDASVDKLLTAFDFNGHGQIQYSAIVESFANDPTEETLLDDERFEGEQEMDSLCSKTIGQWGKLVGETGTHDLDLEEHTLGRSEGCHIVVKDERISCIHCRLFVDNGKAFLEDFSSNGTFVNERVVGKCVRRQLHDGDCIAFVLVVEPKPFSIAFRLDLSPLAANGEIDELTRADSASALKRNTTKPYKKASDVFEEEFTCAICRDIMFNPLTLVPCGHSFCAACLSAWKRASATDRICALCKDKECNMIFINHAFRNILNAYIASHPGAAVTAEEALEKHRNTTLTDDSMPIVLKGLDPLKMDIDEGIRMLMAADTEAQVISMLTHIKDIIAKHSNAGARRYAIPGYSAITTVMREYKDSLQVQQMSLLNLAFAAKNTNATYSRLLKSASVEAHVFEAAVNSVKRFPTDAILCGEANSVCGNLFNKFPELWPEFLEAGGVDMVCTTLKSHPTVFRIQWNGCKLLYSKSYGRGLSEEALALLRSKLEAHGIGEHLDAVIPTFSIGAGQRGNFVSEERLDHLKKAKEICEGAVA